MIRPHPRSAILTLIVLSLATTASAECSWVLWIEPDGQGHSWTRRSAWDSRKACVAEQAQSETAAPRSRAPRALRRAARCLSRN